MNNNINPLKYNCQVLLEKSTLEECNDSSFPTSAYIISYEVDGKDYIDLVVGKKSNIFDMYYDTYGPGVVKKISFGYGKVDPKMWGYKPKEKKRK